MPIVKMDCQRFRKLLALCYQLEQLSWARQGKGWILCFGQEEAEGYQNALEEAMEQAFIRHFDSCFACRQRHQTLGVGSINPIRWLWMNESADDLPER